jgi:hypothetical protein
LIGAAANVGYVLIALLALWSPIRDDSWRWVMLVGAAPALLTFAIRLFVPESHRWEATQKQAVKASPLREIFRPGSRKTTLLAILFASIALIVTSALFGDRSDHWIASGASAGRSPGASLDLFWSLCVSHRLLPMVVSWVPVVR